MRKLGLSLIIGFGVLIGAMNGDVSAQNSQKKLSDNDLSELDTIGAQRRANERKSDLNRQNARDIALEIEDLRRKIIDISKRQGISERRTAIYRAKVETLNLKEADITRRLISQRARESRLLSALQIYSRNPPPAIFVTSRKANDAVLAAIIMRDITPELQKRTRVLIEQNNDLIRIRRETAVQNEALKITENDVTSQRREIEKLISQKMDLEDQLLSQADRYEQDAVALAAKEQRIRGQMPIRGRLGFDPSTGKTTLTDPVVGIKVALFGQTSDLGNGRIGPANRGVTYSTNPGSQVVAPAEGEVEYVGPLDNYGQVIILNIGKSYRVVITGLGRVYVDRGQSVGRNEPLGRMPNESAKKTLLYMELRHDEDTINPETSIALLR